MLMARLRAMQLAAPRPVVEVSSFNRVVAFLLLLLLATDVLAFATFGSGKRGGTKSTATRGFGLTGFTSIASRETTALCAALNPGETVVVIGGTSGVGQLVTRKLSSSGAGYDIRVTSRDASKARSAAGDGVDCVEVDLVGASDVVDEQLERALDGASAVVVSVGTTAFPTLRWRGGNTPSAIDDAAVSKIARQAASSSTIKKVVMVTSVGVDRTGEMPFLVLNLFGVLDAKKRGEQAIISAATSSDSFEYVIVRPGRLVGGPFTNLDVARLLKIEGGAENGVDLEAGDALLGDCKRDACAEAVVRAIVDDDCANVDFSIVSNEEKSALTPEQWNAAFKRMKATAGR